VQTSTDGQNEQTQADPPPENKELLTYHLDTTSPDLDTFFRNHSLTFAKNI
jgi:hypothetical protein